MSKVMDNQLKVTMSLIMSHNQQGFVMGRQILDGIILVHELTHSAQKSRRDGMLLNLDINKAYDRVDCNSFMLVFHKFGI